MVLTLQFNHFQTPAVLCFSRVASNGIQGPISIVTEPLPFTCPFYHHSIILEKASSPNYHIVKSAYEMSYKHFYKIQMSSETGGIINPKRF